MLSGNPNSVLFRDNNIRPPDLHMTSKIETSTDMVDYWPPASCLHIEVLMGTKGKGRGTTVTPHIGSSSMLPAGGNIKYGGSNEQYTSNSVKKTFVVFCIFPFLYF